MRQIGKIERREVFSKVKNVNVESLKIRSKLLDFLGGGSDEIREESRLTPPSSRAYSPRRCVRMAKMQGAEDEGAGSVLKYMTKPESDSNEADWLL